MKKESSTSNNRIYWLVLGIVAVCFISFISGSGYASKDYKRLLKEKAASYADLVSKHKKEKLIYKDSADYQKQIADVLRLKNDTLRKNNRNSINSFNEKSKKTFIIDTAFEYNAKYIARSVNRFYRENDTIR